ncbi:MAG TPA: sigma-70 factor domain-containing protein, partial [Mycobacteriales bacterium]|nr:sigma-70 factor domain-containing protein [Mycobacteriales bacterium]
MSRPHRTQRPTARSDAAGSDASNPAVDSGAEVDERLPDLDEQSAALSADLVRVYLNEIGKVALLNAEQEVELSKRIEAGLYADHLLADAGTKSGTKLTPAKRRDLLALAADGRRAKEHLLQANLRLVVSLAKRYTGHGLP